MIGLVVILLGPPGAGKGTHAAPLSRALQMPHISTGDLFREHIRNQTVLGKLAKQSIDQGQLVSDELVLNMLFGRLEQKDCKEGFILDGFPRTLVQGEALHSRLEATHKIVALNLNIPDSFLVERITGRMVCKGCSSPFHIKNQPPKVENRCDFCHGSLYQRDDDREEVLRKRLEVYRHQTEPLIAFYAKQKNVLREIRADQSQREVFEAVLQALPIPASVR